MPDSQKLYDWDIHTSATLLKRYPIFGFTSTKALHRFLSKDDIWKALPRARKTKVQGEHRINKETLIWEVARYRKAPCMINADRSTRRLWDLNRQMVYCAIMMIRKLSQDGQCWHGKDTGPEFEAIASACLALCGFITRCKAGFCVTSWGQIIVARREEERRLERQDAGPSNNPTSSQNHDSDDDKDDSSYSQPKETPPTSRLSSSTPSSIFVPSRSASVQEVEPPIARDPPVQRTSTVSSSHASMEKKRNRAEADLLRKVNTIVAEWKEAHQELSEKMQNDVLVNVGNRVVNKYTTADVEDDEMAESEMEDLDSIL